MEVSNKVCGVIIDIQRCACALINAANSNRVKVRFFTGLNVSKMHYLIENVSPQKASNYLQASYLTIYLCTL